MEVSHSFATSFSLSNMLYHMIMFDMANSIKEADAGKRELFVVHTGDTVGADGTNWNLIDGCRMVAEVKDDVTDESGDTWINSSSDGSIVSMSLQQSTIDCNAFNIILSFNPVATHVFVRLRTVDDRWNLTMDVHDADGKPLKQKEVNGDRKLFTDIVHDTCSRFLRTTTDRPVTVESFDSEEEEENDD